MESPDDPWLSVDEGILRLRNHNANEHTSLLIKVLVYLLILILFLYFRARFLDWGCWIRSMYIELGFPQDEYCHPLPQPICIKM